MKRLKDVAKLPFTFDLPNHNKVVTLDTLQERHFPEAYKLVQECAQNPETSDIGEDEFPSLEHFKTKFRPTNLVNSCALIEQPSGKLVGMYSLFPSPLSRSSTPVFHTGYAVLDKEYRGGVIITAIQGFFTAAAMCIGYHGIMGRVSITNSVITKQRKTTGAGYPGVIPLSLKAGKKYIDDLICVMDYTKDFKNDLTTFYEPSEPVLPPLNQVSIKASNTCLGDYNIQPFSHTFKNGLEVTMATATRDDVIATENMIRSSAMRGQGFGLDEFTAEGHFNRTMVSPGKEVIFVAKTIADGKQTEGQGHIVASVIAGPTKYCRSDNPPGVTAYLIVAEGYRQQGIGTELVDILCNIAKKANFAGVYLDIFSTETHNLKLVESLGFQWVGWMPKSAYLKHRGLSDCYLMYKNLQNMALRPLVLGYINEFQKSKL